MTASFRLNQTGSTERGSDGNKNREVLALAFLDDGGHKTHWSTRRRELRVYVGNAFLFLPSPVRANYHVVLPDFIHANEFQDFGARPNANWGYTGRMKMYRRLTQSRGKLPAYTWWSSHLCAWLMQVHYTHCTSSICMVERPSTILYTPVYTRWNGTTNAYKYVYTEVTERGTDKISNTRYYVHTCKFTQKHRTMNHRMFFHHYQHPGNENSSSNLCDVVDAVRHRCRQCRTCTMWFFPAEVTGWKWKI